MGKRIVDMRSGWPKVALPMDYSTYFSHLYISDYHKLHIHVIHMYTHTHTSGAAAAASDTG